MTNYVDNVLVSAGLDECELKTIRSRSVLYLGIAMMASFVVMFSALAVNAWFG